MRTARLFLPPVVAWLFGYSLLLADGALLGESRTPKLPSVAVPYDPKLDVVSFVPDLFLALSVAVACVLIVEIAKFTTSKLGTRSGTGYVVLLLFQVVLALDLVRAYAYDWFIYLLSFARLIDLSRRSGIIQDRWVPIPSPWVSFIWLAVTMVALVAITRSSRAPVRST